MAARKKENEAATTKAKQPNRVTVSREDDPKLYDRLFAIIEGRYASTLGECRISLGWRHGVTPDADGRIKRTWTVIAPPTHRSRHNFDVIIELNAAIWNEAGPDLKEYMLHCAIAPIDPVVTKDGDKKCDDAGKPLFKLRKPDIECYYEVEVVHPGRCLEVERLVRAVAPKLPPPERTLMDEMEWKPKTKAEERREKIPGYRGWTLGGPAKVGKAMVEEVARGEIDRFFELVEKGNRSAATMVQRKLEAAGWTAPALQGAAPAARP